MENYMKINSETNLLHLTWNRRVHLKEKDIIDIFSIYGEIKNVLCSKGSRRMAILLFDRIQSAINAKNQINDKASAVLHEKSFYISFATEKKPYLEKQFELSIQNASELKTFDSFHKHLPGLILINDFITEEEENNIIKILDDDNKSKWLTTVKARQVQHYGYTFDYNTKKCNKNEPLELNLPEFCQKLIDKLPEDILPDPDQVTVNEYLPGQGIPAHIDTHSAFTDAIISLSLEGTAVMEFCHPDYDPKKINDVDDMESDGKKKLFYNIVLKPRSLLIMTKESRYLYSHSIPPRKYDIIDNKKVTRKRRISMTFRKLQNIPCKCPFRAQCDSQGNVLHDETDINTSDVNGTGPSETEKLYVHDFYEKVALHFSSTRHTPWPKVKDFINDTNNIPFGSFVADIGCGNGKYMKHSNLSNILMFGADRSPSLLDICRKNGLTTLCLMDALKIPFRSNTFDSIISIALLHHFSTFKHRLQVVNELIRIIKPGGQGLIYAWAQEQDNNSRRIFNSHCTDIIVPWNLDSRFRNNDIHNTNNEIINKVEKVERYCHVFREGEIESLLRMNGNVSILDSYYDQSNWAAHFKKDKMVS